MELLDLILSRENLNKAYLQVFRNKGAAGIDGVTVEELKDYLKEHKDEILWKIRNRKYKPQPVRRVQIPKEICSRSTSRCSFKSCNLAGIVESPC